MAHLWRTLETDGWQPLALHGDVCVLDAVSSPRPYPSAAGVPGDTARVLLRRTAGAGDDGWVLLTSPDMSVLVNGLPVVLGIRVLIDRDEIRLPAAPPVYFSTERLAMAAPFPAGTRGVCPRCKTLIDHGSMAIRCPGECGLWHHASDALPCWTYGDQCAVCPQPTALDAGFRWTPEDL